MKPENLSMKTIINKLDFLKKQFLFNETSEKEDSQLFATKLTEKIPDPRNAKEHYQSFIRKENIKLKTIKLSNYQKSNYQK